jgi:hypothetical protein
VSAPKTAPPRATTPPPKPTRTALKRELRNLARESADGVLEVLDRYSMWDQVKIADDEQVTRVRRTDEALKQVAMRILVELRNRKQAVAISTVAKGLMMTTREIAHPIALLVDEGKVTRTGERRGARYALAPRMRSKRATPKKTAQKKKTASKRGAKKAAKR